MSAGRKLGGVGLCETRVQSFQKSLSWSLGGHPVFDHEMVRKLCNFDGEDSEVVGVQASPVAGRHRTCVTWLDC